MDSSRIDPADNSQTPHTTQLSPSRSMSTPTRSSRELSAAAIKGEKKARAEAERKRELQAQIAALRAQQKEAEENEERHKAQFEADRQASKKASFAETSLVKQQEFRDAIANEVFTRVAEGLGENTTMLVKAIAAGERDPEDCPVLKELLWDAISGDDEEFLRKAAQKVAVRINTKIMDSDLEEIAASRTCLQQRSMSTAPSNQQSTNTAAEELKGSRNGSPEKIANRAQSEEPARDSQTHLGTAAEQINISIEQPEDIANHAAHDTQLTHSEPNGKTTNKVLAVTDPNGEPRGASEETTITIGAGAPQDEHDAEGIRSLESVRKTPQVKQEAREPSESPVKKRQTMTEIEAPSTPTRTAFVTSNIPALVSSLFKPSAVLIQDNFATDETDRGRMPALKSTIKRVRDESQASTKSQTKTPKRAKAGGASALSPRVETFASHIRRLADTDALSKTDFQCVSCDKEVKKDARIGGSCLHLHDAKCLSKIRSGIKDGGKLACAKKGCGKDFGRPVVMDMEELNKLKALIPDDEGSLEAEEDIGESENDEDMTEHDD